MTPAERKLRDAWLSEMWKPCPEVGRVRQPLSAATVARDCVSCGTVFEQRRGPGRPRKYCVECAYPKAAS